MQEGSCLSSKTHSMVTFYTVLQILWTEISMIVPQHLKEIVVRANVSKQWRRILVGKWRNTSQFSTRNDSQLCLEVHISLSLHDFFGLLEFFVLKNVIWFFKFIFARIESNEIICLKQEDRDILMAKMNGIVSQLLNIKVNNKSSMKIEAVKLKEWQKCWVIWLF